MLLLGAISLWALNFTVIKTGVAELDPVTFPLLRCAAGSVLMVVVLWSRERSLTVARADLPLLVTAAALGVTLNGVFFVYSLVDAGASDVALLSSTGPLVTAILVFVFGLEPLPRRHWLGVVVGLGGVALIVFGSGIQSSSRAPLAGDALALGAVLSSSGAALPIRRLMRTYSAWRILTFEMTAGSLMLLPLALPSLIRQNYASVSLTGWASLGYAIVFSGVVAYVLYFTAIHRVGPAHAAMYGYLQTLLGVLFAVMLLGERLTTLQLLGALIVVGSVYWSRPQTLAGRSHEPDGSLVAR